MNLCSCVLFIECVLCFYCLFLPSLAGNSPPPSTPWPMDPRARKLKETMASTKYLKTPHSHLDGDDTAAGVLDDRLHSLKGFYVETIGPIDIQ